MDFLIYTASGAAPPVRENIKQKKYMRSFFVYPHQTPIPDREENGWFLEVNNLNDLLGFLVDEGRCIIDPHSDYGPPSITIYDDYIE